MPEKGCEREGVRGGVNLVYSPKEILEAVFFFIFLIIFSSFGKRIIAFRIIKLDVFNEADPVPTFILPFYRVKFRLSS
jgi:hypothetical protein